MFKKILILTLVFVLVLGVFVNAEKPIPTSLEKPINLTVRDDDGILRPRWANPSIIQFPIKEIK